MLLKRSRRSAQEELCFLDSFSHLTWYTRTHSRTPLFYTRSLFQNKFHFFDYYINFPLSSLFKNNV